MTASIHRAHPSRRHRPDNLRDAIGFLGLRQRNYVSWRSLGSSNEAPQGGVLITASDGDTPTIEHDDRGAGKLIADFSLP